MSIDTRLRRLEASNGDGQRMVVIEMHRDEEEQAAFERHCATHPEDRHASLHVFLVRFGDREVA